MKQVLGMQDQQPYNQDGLHSIHNHEFMTEPRFLRAYARGVQAAGKDYAWHWRVHVGLWAAEIASNLDGDFVECGVNRGFLSSAIMSYISWNELGKTFFLLDTFAGIDQRYVSSAEKAEGILDRNQNEIDSGFYTSDVDSVRRNFSEWNNIVIVVGSVPETLPQITAERIAFLHIDMNCSPPEVAAIDYLWDRLVPGAVVLLDDYAYHGYRQQKLGMDSFAHSKGTGILSLPTGQGLLLKPNRVRLSTLRCSVCGGRSFTDNKILWDKLIADWELSPEEVAYTDRQQGTHCRNCTANLRSIALADAIRAWARTRLTLQEWIASEAAKDLSVLEINEAGTLSPMLRALPGYVLAEYPAIDIHALPYAIDTFDLVVHSDTLEHVLDPLRGLVECRRVLRFGGGLCFTVPTIIGRLTRSRAGLSKSFHGSETTASEDWAVQTEFGADAWTYAIRAGFQSVSIHTIDYPSATAMLACKT